MTESRFSVFPVRVLAAAVAILALGAAFLMEARSPHTAAAIDYGTVTAGSGFIIEGYKAVVPITMTTCTTPSAGYCRLGAYEMKMSFDSTKFSVVSDVGTSTGTGNTTTTLFDTTKYVTGTSTGTGNTTTTLFDTTKNWTVNQWSGADLTFTAGPVVGTYLVLSNTSTSVTINTNAPNVQFPSVPTSASAYALKRWRVNQWAGSAITFTAGPVGGTYQVLSNTNNSITINTNAPNVPFPSVPTTASAYTVGGFTDGGFVFSTGRTGQCFGPTYGTGWAEGHCSTDGAPPDYPNGAYGTGVVAALVVQAGKGPGMRGQVVQFNLNNPTNSFVLQITGTVIPSTYTLGTRRIVICTDPNHDQVINSIDLGKTAAAFGRHSTDVPPAYTGANPYMPEMDPDVNNVINSADLGIVAALFNKRCTQQ